METPSPQPPRIAIVYVAVASNPVCSTVIDEDSSGAGIAGLSLSHALNVLGRDALHIDVYEAAAHVSEIGAGINIWPRTWNVMKALRLSDTLVHFLPHIPDHISSEGFALCAYVNDLPKDAHRTGF